MSDQLAVAVDLYPLRHQATPTHYYEFHLPRLSSSLIVRVNKRLHDPLLHLVNSYFQFVHLEKKNRGLSFIGVYHHIQ
jgi:hypothetical protein